MEQPLTITVDSHTQVSGLLCLPADAHSMYVFAHGAGAGMTHHSMSDIAEALTSQGVASLRYQFPYMERGSKRTDPPPVCHATVRAAVAEAARRAPHLPLFAGGRSFGGRMSSQAQAAAPLANVAGLIFLGFPLHPAKQPSVERAKHLYDVHVSMLFVQGEHDALAELSLLRPIVAELAPRAELHVLAHADHSFHAPVKSGRKDAEVLAESIAAMAGWMRRVR